MANHGGSLGALNLKWRRLTPLNAPLVMHELRRDDWASEGLPGESELDVRSPISPERDDAPPSLRCIPRGPRRALLQRET